MPDRVLTGKADEQLTAARRVLADLRVELATAAATSDDAATLAESIRQLDELFLLVVVGEFNAGKSAFINALLGSRVLEEGVTPTTAQIHLIRYGSAADVDILAGGIRQVTAPVEFLKDIHIVDTPGTNAILREHERLTADFVPRADFVLFVTSADRPFTETERAFIEAIRAWGKKIVIVVNKIDIFEREAEIDQVLTFVGNAAQATLGTRPPIFPVSARLAARAKQGEPALWSASRFEPLERYLRESLDEHGRFRLKLESPLGVADVLARRYLAVADETLELLTSDTAALADIDRQLEQYRDRHPPRVRVAHERRREGAARDGRTRPSVLRRYAAPGTGLRSRQPVAHGERVRGARCRRRAAGDRAARVGDYRLAGRSGVPPVAGDLGESGHQTPGTRRSHPRLAA